MQQEVTNVKIHARLIFLMFKLCVVLLTIPNDFRFCPVVLNNPRDNYEKKGSYKLVTIKISTHPWKWGNGDDKVQYRNEKN